MTFSLPFPLSSCRAGAAAAEGGTAKKEEEEEASAVKKKGCILSFKGCGDSTTREDIKVRLCVSRKWTTGYKQLTKE